MTTDAEIFNDLRRLLVGLRVKVKSSPLRSYRKYIGKEGVIEEIQTDSIADHGVLYEIQLDTYPRPVAFESDEIQIIQ